MPTPQIADLRKQIRDRDNPGIGRWRGRRRPGM
jgi:hypothetical protein